MWGILLSKKSLAIGIIVLFIGASFVPGISGRFIFSEKELIINNTTSIGDKFQDKSIAANDNINLENKYLPRIHSLIDILWFRWKIIQIGDCVDVHYIGRYASNNSVFDSSYEDVNNKTGGSPLKVFVSLNSSEKSPKAGYITVIEGLAEGLIGLKEGDESTIGPIPPEKAYGNKLGIGDTFNTSNLAVDLSQTVQVTELTTEYISLKWINMENFGKFTMPQTILKNLSSMDQDEIIIIPPPYYIWGDSTEIINIEDDTVTVWTTPTNSENLSENIMRIQYSISDIYFIFPDVTTALWNDTIITITSSPEEGKQYHYNHSYNGQIIEMTFTIENVTKDKINISVIYEGSDEKIYQEVNRTIEFSRIFFMPRYYLNIPLMYQEYLFEEDIQREGYSSHELAGEELIFEVVIIRLYKTSIYRNWKTYWNFTSKILSTPKMYNHHFCNRLTN